MLRHAPWGSRTQGKGLTHPEVDSGHLGGYFRIPGNQGMVLKGACRLGASRSSQLWQPPRARAVSPKAQSPGDGPHLPETHFCSTRTSPPPLILTPLSLAGTVALQAFSVSGTRSQTILPHSRSEPPCQPFGKTPNSGSFPHARDNPESLTWSFHQGCGWSPGKNSHQCPCPPPPPTTRC